MQNDRELGQKFGNFFQYIETQFCVAFELERAVARADCDGERVDTRLFYEFGGFLGIGIERVGLGDFNVVFDARESSELGFDDRAVIVRVLYHLGGDFDVFGERMARRVDHNGREPVLDAVYAEIVRIAVIEMQADRQTRILDCGLNHFNEVLGVGVFARARAYLKDERSFFELAGFHDTLYRFHVVDVECADGVAAFIGFCEHILSGY